MSSVDTHTKCFYVTRIKYNKWGYSINIIWKFPIRGSLFIGNCTIPKKLCAYYTAAADKHVPIIKYAEIFYTQAKHAS